MILIRTGEGSIWTCLETAASLRMDQSAFESCLKSGKYKSTVQQDVQAGSEAGVNATPSFFINGEFLSGAQSKADFVTIIERKLAATRGQSAILALR